jgi:hypothetical protein
MRALAPEECFSAYPAKSGPSGAKQLAEKVTARRARL